MRAEIIAVGSELLSFGRAETNSLLLASRLVPLGIDIARKYVVGDRESDLRECLSLALAHSDLVLFSGGLGPTNDDLTRETVAGFLHRPLREDPDLVQGLRERYRRFRIPVKANSLRQAMVPEGAKILPNPRGTAPGLLLAVGDKRIFLLPGPPRELGPMLDDQVVPFLREQFDLKPAPLRVLNIGGEAESAVDARVGPIYLEYEPQVETTILSSPGVITLYFLWKGTGGPDQAQPVLEELVGRVRAELGVAVYSELDESPARALGKLLTERRLTLAVAESCTGGLLGKLVTDVPGSSAYFLGGILCYSNEAKLKLLGVDPGDLAAAGAVSEPVAAQLAAGVRRILGSSVGLSATGIAGPGGGTPEKPVGTVFVGLSREAGTRVRRLNMPGDRDSVRMRTCQTAIDWLRRELQ